MKKQENLYSKGKKNINDSFDYYKPYQLAKKLNKRVQTVYRWIREGKIPKSSVLKVKVEREITIIKFPKGKLV